LHQADFAGEPRVDFDAPPECLLVRREAGSAAVERIAAAEYAWLEALQAGADLSAALDAALSADTAFSFESVLHARIADRTLASVRAH
jgi:hypothetical protein